MTLHEDATATLTRWTPPDPEQAGLRELYLRHLSEHDDGMWRSCRPAHVTASALVVDPSGSKVLLTLHRTVGAWLQLGGHCEAGDTTLAGAALREATEESGLTGLTIEPEPLQLSRHLLRAGGCQGAYHLDVQFQVTATAGTQYVVSEESDDLAWFATDALPAGLDHSVTELVGRSSRQLE
ncbi:NUDIX hydrolase [Kribbella flavida DSM 17836]|uniref:NUDIX hydrolase n=1 Tax=Kribbella flavida (strain DSM 17836 / JCM 10339 / NBRC 14399) TaxID=479435 RepID=D2PL73_KRIFD|nr:NUDIX domain-containing protein [Kribbella flavida]ADB34328.1 NUDIX hydrolase [Kribbella flavida DSM 17836]